MTPRLHKQSLSSIWKAARRSPSLPRSALNGPLTPQLLAAAQAALPPPKPRRTSSLYVPPVVHVKKQRTKKDEERVYPPRKTFLNAYYTHILGKSPLVLLFEHANLSNGDLDKIRAAVKKVPVPEDVVDAIDAAQVASASSSSPSASTTVAGADADAEPTPTPTPTTTPEAVVTETEDVDSDTDDTPAPPKPISQAATFLMIRTGVFRAVSRREQSPSTSLVSSLSGQRALLFAPSLNPPYLQKVLKGINTALKSSQRQGDDNQPKLDLLAGVMEGTRKVSPAEVAEIAKLPDLAGLRAQLLGTLEAPSRQLLGVVSQAGGGSLVRTLQGLEESLKPAEKAE